MLFRLGLALLLSVGLALLLAWGWFSSDERTVPAPAVHAVPAINAEPVR